VAEVPGVACRFYFSEVQILETTSQSGRAAVIASCKEQFPSTVTPDSSSLPGATSIVAAWAPKLGMSNGSSAAVGVAALLLWLAWVGLTT